MRRECWYQSGRKKREALGERGGCVHPVAEGDLPETSAGGGGGAGTPVPRVAAHSPGARRRATRSRAAGSGQGFGPTAALSLPLFRERGPSLRLSEEPSPGPFAPADSPLHH